MPENTILADYEAQLQSFISQVKSLQQDLGALHSTAESLLIGLTLAKGLEKAGTPKPSPKKVSPKKASTPRPPTLEEAIARSSFKLSPVDPKDLPEPCAGFHIRTDPEGNLRKRSEYPSKDALKHKGHELGISDIEFHAHFVGAKIPTHAKKAAFLAHLDQLEKNRAPEENPDPQMDFLGEPKQ